MFMHKKCGKEVCAKSIVHEYANITSLADGIIECGDVTDSVVEETAIFCEDCGEEVSREDVTEEEDGDDA